MISPRGNHDTGHSPSRKTGPRKSADEIASKLIELVREPDSPAGSSIQRTSKKDDVEAILLAYKRYTTPRRLSRSLFTILSDSIKLVDVSRIVACLHLFNYWLRLRIDSEYLCLRTQLIDTLMQLSSTRDATVRTEANRVKLSLLWSNRVRRRLRRPDSVMPAAASSSSSRLWTYNSDLIAEALTQIEHEQFCAVPLTDYNDKAWSRPGLARRLKAFIERSNITAEWVASNILIQPSAAMQLKLFCKFIWIAQRCHKLGNHSSCAAIFAGCSKNCISRLFRVWRTPDKQYRVLYSFIQGVTSPDKNYARYRSLLQAQLDSPDVAFVPHVAVILRDLTFIEDGNSDFTSDDGSPNWQKITMLRSTLTIIQRSKNTPFKKLRDVPPPLRTILEKLPRKAEDYLEKRSNEMRPRGSDSSSVDLYSETSQLDTSSVDTEEAQSSTSSGEETFAELEMSST